MNGRFFYCISGVLLKAQNQRKGLRAAGRNAEHIGGLEDLRVFIDWARILPSSLHFHLQKLAGKYVAHIFYCWKLVTVSPDLPPGGRQPLVSMACIGANEAGPV